MCVATPWNIPFPPHMPTCISILCGRASCLILSSIDSLLPVIAFIQQLRVLSAGCTAYGQVGTATALCHSIDRSQTLVSHLGEIQGVNPTSQGAVSHMPSQCLASFHVLHYI